MKLTKVCRVLIFVWVLILIALPALAGSQFGPRIPTTYFATTGVGESDQGIPPDPYETFSYDIALRNAGIENFNVVYYTSVLPLESNEVPIDTVKQSFHHGAVLESIMAKAGGIKGDTAAAGIGRVWAVDAEGKAIGGFAAEYERIYTQQKVAAETAKQEAIKQLTASLKHELSLRGLSQKGEMKFNITSLYIQKNYGMALAALGFVDFIYPDPVSVKTADKHKPITMELINLVEKNAEIRNMLETSIAEARKINPDPKTNPVQSLPDYYDFIDRASELIPQDVLDNPSSLIRDQILQSICYFYFLVDQPLTELQDKGLFKNTIQYYKPFSSWLRNFVKAWGAFLDTENSWNDKTYQEFYHDPSFGLQKGWYEPSSHWNTFNRFFARYLKSPDARPVASPDDPSVVVSPADSVPQGVWAIDENSNILVDGGLNIKLAKFYNIKDLLGEDSQYQKAFANGVLTHTFLNVNDYHRYHFAVGGIVKEKKVISQNVALEVAWSPEEGKYIPIDSTGWQFSQTRGYVIVDTGEYGLVALIPMGMAQVSSVNFEDEVRVGSTHKKGSMLGNFLFGGSDFVMLFQDKAGFELTAAPEDTTATKSAPGQKRRVKTYKHLLMGEEYGVMRGQTR